MKNRLILNKKYIKIIGISIIFLVLPLILILVRQNQDKRSSAAPADQLETEGGVLSSTGASKVTDSGASGGQYVSFTNQTPTPTKTPTPTSGSNVTYTDYIVPTNIDKSGTTDVTTALNNFIATVPSGPSATHHSRIVFPAGGIYMTSRGIAFSGRSHVTFWGNGATIKTNPAATAPWQYTSAFNLGWSYGGSPTSALGGGGTSTNIRITGFSGLGTNTPTPGSFVSTYENQSFIEAGKIDGLEVDNNTNVRGFGGDFMRIHGTNIHIHHNSQVNAGRQFVSVIEGNNILIENNSMGVVGYFFLDVEPNNADESVTDVDFINNTGVSHSHGISGGLYAGGSGLEYDVIGRIHVRNNTLTGSSNSSLKSYIGQNSHNRMTDIAITGNRGAGPPITVSSCNSNSTGQNGGLIQVKVVDGLTVTGNTQPGLTGPFVCALNSTNVNTTNPPNTTN